MCRRPGSLRGIVSLFLACAVWSSSDLHAQTTVELRGDLPSITGRIVSVGDEGIEIVDRDQARFIISLDLVRDLRGEGADDPDFRSRRALAESIWRARTRLVRGDHALAEPLFEQSFQRMQHATHETALIVAEGLLRCRLSRGDHVRAVAPMLEVIRLKRNGVVTGAYDELPPVIDEDLWLCPELPPIWVMSQGFGRLADELLPWTRSADPHVSQLAALYHEAADRAHRRVGRGDERAAAPSDAPRRAGSPVNASGDDQAERGLRLLRLFVAAETASEDALHRLRDLARDPAARSVERAWAALAAGRAMITSAEPARRLAGSVLLLQLPASHAKDFPYISGLALAFARDARRAEGRDDEAGILDRELNARYPGHPVRQRSTGLSFPSSDSITHPGDSA